MHVAVSFPSLVVCRVYSTGNCVCACVCVSANMCAFARLGLITFAASIRASMKDLIAVDALHTYVRMPFVLIQKLIFICVIYTCACVLVHFCTSLCWFLLSCCCCLVSTSPLDVRQSDLGRATPQAPSTNAPRVEKARSRSPLKERTKNKERPSLQRCVTRISKQINQLCCKLGVRTYLHATLRRRRKSLTGVPYGTCGKWGASQP